MLIKYFYSSSTDQRIRDLQEDEIHYFIVKGRVFEKSCVSRVLSVLISSCFFITFKNDNIWIVAITKIRKKRGPKRDIKKKIAKKSLSVLLPITNSPGKYVFYCPGCQDYHTIDTISSQYTEGHELTGTLSRPTIYPSILSRGDKQEGKPRCHSFITKGKIRFTRDTEHKLAGKTTTLKPID